MQADPPRAEPVSVSGEPSTCLGAALRRGAAAGGPHHGPPSDPLRLCIFTTIAVLAWLLTPPLVVVWMAALGAARTSGRTGQASPAPAASCGTSAWSCCI